MFIAYQREKQKRCVCALNSTVELVIWKKVSIYIEICWLGAVQSHIRIPNQDSRWEGRMHLHSCPTHTYAQLLISPPSLSSSQLIRPLWSLLHISCNQAVLSLRRARSLCICVLTNANDLNGEWYKSRLYLLISLRLVHPQSLRC